MDSLLKKKKTEPVIPADDLHAHASRGHDSCGAGTGHCSSGTFAKNGLMKSINLVAVLSACVLTACKKAPEIPSQNLPPKEKFSMSESTPSINQMKVFLPAKEFKLSRQFYLDCGFSLDWEAEDGSLATFSLGNQAFMLQNFYAEELAKNLMIHVSVPSVDEWWAHISESKIAEKYGIKIGPPEQRPWGMRDFFFKDPSGILWRIGGE